MHSFGFLIDEGERLETLLAALQEGAPTGWRPSRIIFRNFWFFDREEFHWHHGRLFLGGQNAAGKSTVLSMAVPLLLDGNKSEDRLNTFGGKGRHMSYYVTGSADPDDTSEAAYSYPARISYLALEFYHPDGDRYLTFGQGLQHDRASDDKSVRSWGFVIRDGRRVGRAGFDLVRENGASLGRTELKRLLENGGELFETIRDYKREVNRLLFGFKDPADFDALIDLLLQIRRPKLTKEVRPRDVAEILTASLPPLDEGVMQVTATSLDHIDQTTQNLEQLAAQIAAAAAVEKATATVYRRMAEEAAARFEQACRQADRAVADRDAQEAALVEQRQVRERAREELARCEARLAELSAERAALQQHDAVQAAERLAEVEREIAAREEQLQTLRGKIRQREALIKQHKRDLSMADQEWEEQRTEGLETISAAAEAAEEARWESAGHWVQQVRERWERLQPGRAEPDLAGAIPVATVKSGARERREQIAAIEQAVAERDRAEGAWQAAAEAEQQALQALLEAEAAVTAAANDLEERRGTAAAAVIAWREGAAALRVPLSALDPVLAALQRYGPDQEQRPHQALEPLRPELNQAIAAAEQDAAGREVHLAQLEQELTELQQQRERLNAAPPEPDRTSEQRRAREALAAAGIPFAPLYELVEFGPEPGPAGARIEQALAEMGLLDALAVPAGRRGEALSLLQAHGLSERLLLAAPTAGGSGDGASGQGQMPNLAHLLRLDTEHPLTGEVTLPLGDIAVDAAFSLVCGLSAGNLPASVPSTGDRSPGAPIAGEQPAARISASRWQHGLLEGVAAPAESVRYIGRAARERFRQAEITRLEAAIREQEGQIAQVKVRLAELAARIDALRADWARLESLPEFNALAQAAMAVSFRRQQVTDRQQALQEARQRTLVARQAFEAAANRLVHLYRTFPPAEGLDREGLQNLGRWTDATERNFTHLHQQARLLMAGWEKLRMLNERLAADEGDLEERKGQLEEGEVELRSLTGRREGLRRVLERPDTQAVFARIREIDATRPELEQQKERANREDAVANHRVTALEEALPGLRQQAEEALARAATARQRLAEAVQAYPTLEGHRFDPADDPTARKVARTLLNRWVDRPSLIDDVAAELRRDLGNLAKVFEEQRATLRSYYPELRPGEAGSRLIQFNLDGAWVTPNHLLQRLEADEVSLRGVLQRHEAELFERHLLQDVGREVRRCLLKAEDWVRNINELLEAYPLRNDERVWLDWSPKQTEHEMGGTIARQARLLWMDEAAMTREQRDALKSAFQEEIQQIREQAKRGEWRADLFRERLAAVLDYRTWFRFRIFVRGGVSGKQEITETVHNARSGSERALVLLLPLLAGLSVRYDQAAPEAPRILALDEGFAGIDAVNSRQLIRFLTALRLTWVVTSEKLPALTEDLPGATFYAMLREGTVVAARPFVWDGRRLRDADEADEGWAGA